MGREFQRGRMKTSAITSLFDLFESRNRANALSDHDLAVLADWAHQEQKETPNPDWKRAYALIREGADLLLRRRARSQYVGASCPLVGCTTIGPHEHTIEGPVQKNISMAMDVHLDDKSLDALAHRIKKT